MPNQAVGIYQTGLNIRCFQPRIAIQDSLPIVACSQHPQDMFNSQATTPDDRFATENFRDDGNAVQEFILVSSPFSFQLAPCRSLYYATSAAHGSSMENAFERQTRMFHDRATYST